jgi:mannose-1-phosphate guanylyltransferase
VTVNTYSLSNPGDLPGIVVIRKLIIQRIRTSPDRNLKGKKMNTYKAKAYYPQAESFIRIEEPESSFDSVCADHQQRGFKVVECTDEWEDIGPWKPFNVK